MENHIFIIRGSFSERTFIAVKPDGVQRGLVAKVIARFEERGYKLVGLKAIVPSKELAEEHYGDLKSKPFFGGLVDYMTNGQVNKKKQLIKFTRRTKRKEACALF